MADSIIFLKEGGEGYYEEKKSRFLAACYRIESEEEAVGLIEAVKKKYWDARHNCYAYVLGANNELMRFSDDGEPSGTAGKPILEVLTARGIHNCLIIVTRYFGGTLLGTGGLVRAYQKSSIDAVDNSILARRTKGSRITISTDYSSAGKIQYAAQQNGWMLTDTIYAADVSLVIEVPMPERERVVKEAVQITSGKAVINEENDIDIEETVHE
jgi:uncharacterized YigZ family protein